MLKPFTLFLSKALHIKRRGAAIFVTVFFYIMSAAVIWGIAVAVFAQIYSMAMAFPDFYKESILPIIADIIEAISRLITCLVPDAAAFIGTWFDRFTATLSDLISTASQYLVGKGTQFAGQVPLFLLTVIFTIFCSILISEDYTSVVSFLLRQLPQSWRGIFFECKEFAVSTLWCLCKAYSKILLITFSELSLGFLFLGISNPIGTAALVSLLDILPLIGTGGILIPWGIISLLQGEKILGTGILFLYIILTVIRNLIEPKIVGTSIGLHPLVTVIAMYAGLRLFGIFGAFLAPILVLLIQFLNNRGKIHLYN